MTQNITEIFNQFAGKEVQPDANDPTLLAMKKAASDNGLKLRVWFPGMISTMDYRTDRVNAHVGKGADGKYRVSGRFNIG
jgi:hypothetical protein